MLDNNSIILLADEVVDKTPQISHVLYRKLYVRRIHVYYTIWTMNLRTRESVFSMFYAKV